MTHPYPGLRQRARRTLPLGLCALSALSALWMLSSSLGAQDCPPPPPPLTHGPIASFDDHTIALAQFDESLTIQTEAGEALTKGSYILVDGGGLFESGAMRVLKNRVGIYPLPAFDKAAGTIEFWVKPDADTTSKQILFSLRGASSLNGDPFTDLIVGETPTNSSPASPGTSHIYFGTPSGLNINNATTFEAVAPRGLVFADIDGDGKNDLIVADNFADTLSNPVTGTPGEIHIYSRNIKPNQKLEEPDGVIELDLPQGMVGADVNGDGFPDLTTASFSQSNLALWGYINDGSGLFSPSYGPLGSQFVTSSEGVAYGDVDKDGVLDFLYGSFNLANSYMLFGQLDGTTYSFPAAAAVARSDQTLGVDIGDVDGDGWPDAILAQPLFDNGPGTVTGRIAIHLNDGAGGFSASPDATIMTPRPFTVHAGKDVNNDGFIDIVVANWRNGPGTTDHSSVFLGPVTGSPLSTDELTFAVNDAVSMAMGDFNGDGIDDLFFHSSTANVSPLFLLDKFGRGTNGLSAQGHFLPNQSLPTQPTINNPAGEGAGVMAASVGGTSAYGSTVNESNSFLIYVENDQLHFEVHDRRDRLHKVVAPLPSAGDLDASYGFHHVQAEWWPEAGLLELRVGHPDKPDNIFRTLEPNGWVVSAVAPLFRLGSDWNNQAQAAGYLIDDFRLSSVRRSEMDEDLDGFEDGWDNCPTTSNPEQLDFDNDGLGDACVTCQPDIGFGGPGNLVISVCGQPLCSDYAPNFQLTGGKPNAVGLLFAGLINSPLPFKGGQIVPTPWLFTPAIQVDASGRLQFPLPGGAMGAGSIDLYMQVALADSDQIMGAAISNALKVTFLD